MNVSKFVLLASLLASSASVFAEDYFTISGKRIDLHEQRSDMIAKLGKPTAGKDNWISWGTNNISVISAEFSQYGINSLDTSKCCFYHE